MTPRALYTIAALAALAVLAAVLGERRGPAGGEAAGGLVLPGLAGILDDVVRVAVIGPGGETAATIEHDGERWTVVELDAYPADVSQLRAALVALSEARVVERMTDDPARYDRLGVQDVARDGATGRLIRIETGAGASRALILGNADRAEERYVRRPGESASLRIDRDPEAPLAPADWVVPVVVDIPASRVASVSIRHADGDTLELAKAEPSQRDFAVADLPDGRTLEDIGAVNAAGAALRELALVDVARFDAGDAGRPLATARYETFDGLIVTVRAREIGGERWVTLDADAADSAAPAIVDEAAAIAARVERWRYRIPARAYDALTRRIDALLEPRGE